jgi:Zn-dependent peptidase ImmA (M78 family)
MPLNKLSLERQKQIVDLIDDLRLSLGMTYPENGLKSIIRQAIPNVVLKEDDFKGNADIRGALFRESAEYDKPLIAIQSRQNKAAKTFTLAHEFGHFLLGHNPLHNHYIDHQVFDGSKTMQDEGEANFFAMELLMPKSDFVHIDVPGIADSKIAEYFGVSENSVRVRRNWLMRNGY